MMPPPPSLGRPLDASWAVCESFFGKFLPGCLRLTAMVVGLHSKSPDDLKSVNGKSPCDPRDPNLFPSLVALRSAALRFR